MDTYGFTSNVPQSSSILYQDSPQQSVYLHHTHQSHYNSDVRSSLYRGYEQGCVPHHYNGEPHNEIMERLETSSMQHSYPPYVYSPCPTWSPANNGYGINSYASHLQRNPKQKRSRMSLQKRLLVNARERERMRVLNKAFEALRDVLPCYIADGHMAKITTLRLAINYIKALTDLLNDQNDRSNLLNDQKNGDDSHEHNLKVKIDKSREELFNSVLKDTKLNTVSVKQQSERCKN